MGTKNGARGNCVMRHTDAGYEEAMETGKKTEIKTAGITIN